MAVFIIELCVCVSTLQQDSLGNQFSQLSLATGEVPEHQTGVFSQSMVLQNPAPTSYVLQPGQPVPMPTYPPHTPSIQQQGYIQQPVQQVHTHTVHAHALHVAASPSHILLLSGP